MKYFSKIIFSLLIVVAFSNCVWAQMGKPVDSARIKNILSLCEKKFPKFYREFNYIKSYDTLIKKIIFVEEENGTDNGPAKAGPKGNIFIDVKYFEQDLAGFDDNRLIVVLYHEIGHLHYFSTTPVAERKVEENEKFAFEYSLKKTKELADKGDCQPLNTGLYFMKLRSQSNNIADAHVRALKRMVNEPLYESYVDFVKQNCK